MNLQSLGWNTFFEESFQLRQSENYTVGRVTIEHKERYELYAESGPCWAEVTGRFRYLTEKKQDFPAVGDWVVIQIIGNNDLALIHDVLPRKNRISRKTAGVKTEEQILAANVDKVFIVSGLDHDYNLRRIERYLTMAAENGAQAVILLNKADLCPDIDEKLNEIKFISRQSPVCVLSAIHHEGIEALKAMIGKGETAVLLGSYGVGKSTIINHLIGHDVQTIQSVSGYMDKGRHTTVRRELFALSNGGLLIDTPGLRELQLWSGEESLAGAFEDIEILAAQCRYRDCLHEHEPGCAVQQALHDGSLDVRRLNNYLKMLREIRYLALRQDVGAAGAEKLRWKKIKSEHKHSYKKK